MNTTSTQPGARRKEKLLFISRWFPYPADNGSKIRIFNLIRQLSTQYEIDLVSFAEAGEADQNARQAMQTWCRTIRTVPLLQCCPRTARSMLAFFSRLPRSVIVTNSREMRTAIQDLAAQTRYDVVIASQVDTASYALAVDSPLRVFEEVELTFYKDSLRDKETLPGRLRFGMTYMKHMRYIRLLASRFEACTVASRRELDELSSLVPQQRFLGMIPNGLDMDSYRDGDGLSERDTLIYPGALTYFANLDAMRYFLGQVYPLILAHRPQVKLAITGKLNGVPVESLPLDRLPSREAVQFTGYLQDVRPRIAHSWASVVPLQAGGGTRLKILESLALGTPVVSTSKGAEGLDLIPGRDLLIGDTPKDFAASVLQLLQDEPLRAHLSRCGREAVAARYDWNTIGSHYLDFLEQVKREKQRV